MERRATIVQNEIKYKNNKNEVRRYFVHVDLVVEKVRFPSMMAEEGGRGGGDNGFNYTMTCTPYPINDGRTNVLRITEHRTYANVIDKFCVERMITSAIVNNDAESFGEEGGGRTFPRHSTSQCQSYALATQKQRTDALRCQSTMVIETQHRPLHICQDILLVV